MPKVLFVCRANIFRSPLAEGLLQSYIKEGLFPEAWETASAGTWARGGDAIHSWPAQVLKDKGVKIDGHRSREINAEMMSRANLVLTMEGGQAEALRAEFPEQAEKVHMLSVLKGERRDIEDPVGGTEEEFRETLGMIEYYMKGSEERMKEMCRR